MTIARAYNDLAAVQITYDGAATVFTKRPFLFRCLDQNISDKMHGLFVIRLNVGNNVTL